MSWLVDRGVVVLERLREWPPDCDCAPGMERACEVDVDVDEEEATMVEVEGGAAVAFAEDKACRLSRRRGECRTGWVPSLCSLAGAGAGAGPGPAPLWCNALAGECG